MNWLFTAIFIAAVCVQVWTRLSAQTRDALSKRATTMLNKVIDAGRSMRDRIMRRRTSYRQLFLGAKGELNIAGRVVLADLTKFCRGLTSTTVVSPTSGMVDPYASGIAEGRREVWLRIMKELNLDPREAIVAMQEEDVLAA